MLNSYNMHINMNDSINMNINMCVNININIHININIDMNIHMNIDIKSNIHINIHVLPGATNRANLLQVFGISCSFSPRWHIFLLLHSFTSCRSWILAIQPHFRTPIWDYEAQVRCWMTMCEWANVFTQKGHPES